MSKDESADKDGRAWDRRKSAMMESWLGKEHNLVMHAIIPYAIGGGLDLYYYPNGLFGTAIATKELSNSPDEGSSNDVYRTYELVMFTRHAVDLKLAKDPGTPFGKIHRTINSVLNCIARYSAQATLNPRQTCEFPADMKNVGGKCLIFAQFSQPSLATENFGLLAVIEVFRSEMDFARKHGGGKLLEKLKDRGFYPFSDLDREPVA